MTSLGHNELTHTKDNPYLAEGYRQGMDCLWWVFWRKWSHCKENRLFHRLRHLQCSRLAGPQETWRHPPAGWLVWRDSDNEEWVRVVTFHTISMWWQYFGPERNVEENVIDRCVFVNGIDSMAPERCGNDFTSVFSKLILWIDISRTSCEIGLRCQRTPFMISQHWFK